MQSTHGTVLLFAVGIGTFFTRHSVQGRTTSFSSIDNGTCLLPINDVVTCHRAATFLQLGNTACQSSNCSNLNSHNITQKSPLDGTEITSEYPGRCYSSNGGLRLFFNYINFSTTNCSPTYPCLCKEDDLDCFRSCHNTVPSSCDDYTTNYISNNGCAASCSSEVKNELSAHYCKAPPEYLASIKCKPGQVDLPPDTAIGDVFHVQKNSYHECAEYCHCINIETEKNQFRLRGCTHTLVSVDVTSLRPNTCQGFDWTNASDLKDACRVYSHVNQTLTEPGVHNRQYCSMTGIFQDRLTTPLSLLDWFGRRPNAQINFNSWFWTLLGTVASVYGGARLVIAYRVNKLKNQAMKASKARANIPKPPVHKQKNKMEQYQSIVNYAFFVRKIISKKEKKAMELLLQDNNYDQVDEIFITNQMKRKTEQANQPAEPEEPEEPDTNIEIETEQTVEDRPQRLSTMQKVHRHTMSFHKENRHKLSIKSCPCWCENSSDRNRIVLGVLFWTGMWSVFLYDSTDWRVNNINVGCMLIASWGAGCLAILVKEHTDAITLEQQMPEDWVATVCISLFAFPLFCMCFGYGCLYVMMETVNGVGELVTKRGDSAQWKFISSCCACGRSSKVSPTVQS